MALPLYQRVGRSPLGRAALACLGILGLAGLAQAVMPLACSGGASFCDEAVELADLSEPAVAAESDVVPAAPPSVMLTPPAAAAEIATPTTDVASLAPPTPNAQDLLIAGSFAALEMPSTAGLVSRNVRTLPVDETGTPVPPDPPDPLVAEAEPPPVEPPPAAEPSPPRRVGAPPEVPETSLAYAPASGDTAKVTGAGANVRAKPARGGSEVLFALAGGEEVTIVERSRGWARIVDDRGRSGWIYGDYLRR